MTRTSGVIERSVAVVWIAMSCANKLKMRLVSGLFRHAVFAIIEPGMHKAVSAEVLHNFHQRIRSLSVASNAGGLATRAGGR